MGNSESGARFRGLVLNLQEQAVPSDSEIWSKFWMTPQNPEEIFVFIQPEDLRAMKKENLIILLQKLVEFISINFVNAKGAATRNSTNKALVCLARIVPVLFETESEVLFKEFEVEKPAMLVQIFHCVKVIMFYPGFTSEPVWFSGLYKDKLIELPRGAITRDCNESKLCVLRLILALMSQTIYLSHSEFGSKENIFAKIFCCDVKQIGEKKEKFSINFNKRRELFDSLVNGFMKHTPHYGRISSLTENAVDRELSIRSLQLLVALVDYCPVHETDKNEFLGFLQNFCRTATSTQTNILIKAINEHLKQAASAISTRNADSDLFTHQEVLILLWRLLTCIDTSESKFIENINNYEDVTNIFESVFLILWHCRKRAADVGLIHILVFLLLVISSQREFIIKMNNTVDKNLSIKEFPVGVGRVSNLTWNDLFVLVLYKVIVDGRDGFRKLFSCLVTSLANISPYVTNLHVYTCSKIFELYSIFVKRKAYHSILPLMFNTFSNIIQYQYSTNLNFVYTLCTNESLFKFDGFEAKKVQSIKALLNYLLPKLESLKLTEEKQVREFLESTTLVGVLPVPHPIVIRKYEPNKYTSLWFSTYLWGVIFLRSKDLPLWKDDRIKLFAIDSVKS